MSLSTMTFIRAFPFISSRIHQSFSVILTPRLSSSFIPVGLLRLDLQPFLVREHGPTWSVYPFLPLFHPYVVSAVWARFLAVPFAVRNMRFPKQRLYESHKGRKINNNLIDTNHMCLSIFTQICMGLKNIHIDIHRLYSSTLWVYFEYHLYLHNC